MMASISLLSQLYFIEEDFNNVESDINFHLLLPTGWTGDMTVQMGIGTGGGELGSNALVAEIDQQTQSQQVFTPIIGPLLAGTTVEFSYRLIGETSNIDLGEHTISIKIAGTPVLSITGATHTPTENWTLFSEMLTTHIGESVALELNVTRDPQAPAGQSLLVVFDDVKVYAPVDNDLVAVSIIGDMMPPVGSEATYTVTVRNNGEQTASRYTVYLYQANDANDMILDSVEGSELVAGQSQEHILSFVPAVNGEHIIYGWVFMVGDINTANDKTAELSIYAPVAGTIVAQIGNNQSLDFFTHPFYYSVDSAVSQQIYLQSEIGYFGTIYTLVFRYQNNSVVSPTANATVKLYLGTTDSGTFNSLTAWIPLASFQLVYEGELDVMHSGLYDVFVPLDTPYNYTNGNLVIMGFLTDSSLSTNYGAWQTTVVNNISFSVGRALIASTWGTYIDITTGFPSNGTMSRYLPNISILFSNVTADTDNTLPTLQPLLKQNYPNPFNPATTIAFDIVTDGKVVVNIYNVRGQLVRRLIDKHLSVGEHTVVWDGHADTGETVSSGVYLYRMSTGGFESVKKMVIMK